MQNDSDIQLMLSFRDGDKNAFRELYDKHKKRVINYCFRFCGNRSVAEDMAQETFLRVLKAARRYEPTARFSTWLFKIASNVCLNELRRPRYRNPTESLEEEREDGKEGFREAVTSDTDRDFAFNEMDSVVRKALGALPDKQRAALLLRIDGEFSYREIGEQIHCSENHVKILIYRARQQLKETLALVKGESI
ncbi:MAG: sigma-70 family RNA polymerase sigma factor [Desulfobacteraceae bacterium]|nr:sigma-70 family RNA polymerase sigma factor [Desulfobacteraceae bacterium]MBU4001965.1 sigma-70 family RNA polymerase sigma factor [Pseudomonadota bacterium]